LLLLVPVLEGALLILFAVAALSANDLGIARAALKEVVADLTLENRLLKKA
jgi:hypothetical protein